MEQKYPIMTNFYIDPTGAKTTNDVKVEFISSGHPFFKEEAQLLVILRYCLNRYVVGCQNIKITNLCNNFMREFAKELMNIYPKTENQTIH